jgi:hypothetical protein
MLAGQMAAAVLVLAVRRQPPRDWVRVAAGPVVVAVSVLPWMSAVRRVASLDRFWSPLPEPLFFVDYFHRFFGQDLTVSLVAGGLLLALPLILRGRSAVADDGEGPSAGFVAAVLAASVAVSLLAAYVRSHLVVPMLMPRFTFVFLPAVLLLITIAMCGLRPPKVRAILTLAIVVLSLAGLARSDYYTQPRKEQWREAVQTMASDPRFDPGADRCLAVLAPGFQYYADRLAPGFEIAEMTQKELEAVVAEGSPLPVLWLLLPRGESPDRDFRAVQRRLWGRTDRIELIKMVVERWHPRRRPWDPESDSEQGKEGARGTSHLPD